MIVLPTTIRLQAQSICIAPAHLVCDYNVGNKVDTQLKNKMLKALTSNGISIQSERARFALVPTISILSENTIADIPPKTEMDLEVNFALVDAMSGKIFESNSYEVKAKGTNKINAIYRAVSNLSLSTPEFDSFMQKAQKRVIRYYEQSLDQLIRSAESAAKMGHHERALAILDEIPSEISGYGKVSEVIQKIYGEYKEKKAAELYQMAEAAWIAQPNLEGAKKASIFLSQIPTKTQQEAKTKNLIQRIEKRIKEENEKEWKFIFDQYERRHREEMNRIDSWRQISVEYARNQPIEKTKVVFW